MKSNIRTLRIKKVKENKPKSEFKTLRIKRLNVDDEIKTLRVYSFKNFYDKYMGDVSNTPKDYITGLTSHINLIYYYLNTTVYEKDEKIDLMMAKLKDFEYNRYIDIYTNVTPVKLQKLGVLKTMSEGIRKLYDILHYLINVENKDINIITSLYEIRSKLIWNTLYGSSSDRPKLDRVKLKRMIAIKDNVIVETGDYITPNDALKGSSVMIEYNNNLFTSIPYRTYVKFANIQYLVFNYTLNDVTDYMQSDEYEKVELVKVAKYCYSIQEIIKTVVEYFDRWEAIEHMLNEALNFCLIFESTDESVEIIYKDGSGEILNMNEFTNIYFDYMCG